MPIDAKTYFDASQEHISSARELYRVGHYGLVIYLSGLSVECMLRAYRKRLDPLFDSRHDLGKLVDSARFYDAVPVGVQPLVASALSEVVLRWRNDHRFRSNQSLLKWVKSKAIDRRARGDLLKETSRRTLEAAWTVVSQGVLRWSR